MERFLPKEGVVVATVYASITFPPCPTLVFKVEPKSGIPKLVATGSLYQVNPDRIIAKKIVLSGFPFKINKKSAVIRHIFFNRGMGFHIMSCGHCGVAWYGMVWYGMVWYGMVWYGMVWYGMV
jgi:hypothetical protein